MFKQINQGKLPTRGTKYSAAVDLYANEDVVIGAGETAIIGLGVCIDADMLDNLIHDMVVVDKSITIDNDRLYFYTKNRIAKIEKMTDDVREIDMEYQLGKIELATDDFKKSHYIQLMLRSSLGAKGLILPNGVGVIDLDFIPSCKIGHNINTKVCAGFKPKEII